MNALTSLLARGRAALPRSLMSVIALLCLGWALRVAIAREVPVGRIQGSVKGVTLNLPLADADIVLYTYVKNEEGERVRRAVSGADGRFTLANVPVGSYLLSANSRAHAVRERYVTVEEGQTAQVELDLKRSEADLSLNQHQKIFGSQEKPFLAVSGYIDANNPRRTDALQVKIYRTRLSRVLNTSDGGESLQRLGNSYQPLETLPENLLRPSEGTPPQKLPERAVRITEDDREGFFYQRIPFDPMPTGLYLMEIGHAKKTLTAWMLVTDTALIIKQAQPDVLAYAVQMQSGRPLPGTEIRAYRKGRILARGMTDSQGLSEFKTPEKRRAASKNEEGDEDGGEGGAEEESGQTLMIAVRGEDEAVVRSWNYGYEQDGKFAVHTYTDRPIYRPGQRVYFKGVARRRQEPNPNGSDSWMNYSVPANEPVEVEIRDPAGEKILTKRCLANRFGSYAGSVDLLKEAPAGVYTILTRARGERHTHDFVLASYRKPEFEVTVTPEKPYYARGDSMQMRVSAQFYFGAPVVGATVKYAVYRTADWSADYGDDWEADEGDQAPASYRHGGTETYYGEVIAEGTATLDESGKAILAFQDTKKLSADAPQALEYTASVTIKEPDSEREAFADGKAKAYAGAFRLSATAEGYLAAPDVPTNIIVTAKDHAGKPLPNRPVQLERGYWQWDKEKEESVYQVEGAQDAVTGADGRVVVAVTPKQSGNLTVKVRARDDQRREIVTQTDLWVVRDRGADLNTEYADLSLLTDKKRYQPGETARALINSSRVGQEVLLTVEGDRIYRKELIPMRQKSVVVRVPIRAEYGPNVSLEACYVRNKKFAQSSAPLRVTLPQRELKVTVQPDRAAVAPATLATYQPGDSLTYTITTTDYRGQPVPCELSLGVVDESIYALREDSPNALRDSFYPRRYNRVRTEYSFAVEYLGDADKAEPKMTTRKNFPDTALWEPFVQTDAQGKATVRLNLPDNLTTWRATVTAHTTDTQLGRAVAKVISTKDFFVRVETPRFVTQYDKTEIRAIVHNATGTTQQAVVRCAAENMTLSGDATRTLTVESGKYAEVVWAVSVENTGTAKLRVSAWTPEGAGKRYTDAMETTLPIRTHGREQFAAYAGTLTSERPEIEVVRLEPNANADAVKLTVRVTPSLVSAFQGAADYLIGFPYGCAEQTTSRFLGNLYVQRLIKQGALRNVPNADRIPRYVRGGLQKLYRMQNGETGGWGWFEQDKPDPWITAYVMTGLLTAQREGYPVSQRVLDRGREAMKRLAQKPTFAEMPFLLYALALAGDKTTAKQARATLNLGLLGTEALAYVVLLDTLVNPGAVSPALARMNQWAKTTSKGVAWLEETTNGDNPTLLNTATAFRALVAAQPNDSRLRPILFWMMGKRTGDYWISTRDTTAVLAALSDYIGTFPGAVPQGRVTVRVNGQAFQTITLTPDAERLSELVFPVPFRLLRPDKNEIALERTGGTSPVFYSVHLRQTVPTDAIPALLPPKYALTREVRRVLSQQLDTKRWELKTEPTNNQLKAGEALRVRLKITVPEDLEYVLIEDPLPAGCSLTERGSSEEVVEWGYWWSSVDVRDDRIAFFARRLPKGEHVIEYNLRAQTPGEYRVLPTLVQPMYAPATQIETGATKLSVR